MTTTRIADLGWAMARCTIEQLATGATEPAASLTIVEPEGDDTPAKSIEIAGLENLLFLHDLIRATIVAWEDEIAMAKELSGRGLTTGD